MRKWVLIITAILLFTSPVFAYAAEEAFTPSITVQGSGRVTVTPDLATISFAVTEEGEEASQVQKVITDKANAVKKALSEAGLPDDKFQTAGIMLYTRFDYSEGVEKAIGYQGQISMSVDEIGIDEVGKYLQLISLNGVNEIDGINVFYSGYEEAYNEALGKAMIQARQKAETLAKAEGAEVTNEFTVTEGWQDTSLQGRAKNVVSSYTMESYDEAAAAKVSDLDFTVGTTEIEAAITVCYKITTK